MGEVNWVCLVCTVVAIEQVGFNSIVFCVFKFSIASWVFEDKMLYNYFSLFNRI
jgi:hypothetical protein